MSQETVRYRRNPDYIFRKIVDELVLVPIKQNVADMDAIYTMNPVGATIWEKLESEPTLDELRAAVLDEFDAAPEVVAADLLEFLAELEDAGAVWRV